MPAVPFAVNQKSFTPPVSTPDASAANGAAAKAQKPAPSQAAMDEAARQAKEAVAAAMAKLNPQAAVAAQNKASSATAAVDALTRRVSEMSTSAAANGTSRGRGGFRGRGNIQRGSGQKKMEIPKTDFDFESANAKFNKGDLGKEAIASASPLEESPAQEEGIADPSLPTPDRKDSLPNTAAAYNKSTSFFDNISSEAKDREEGPDGRGRQIRSEEFKKNVETFGQGNVDGGYRGRGRGGGYGRGRQYGGTYRGGYNNNRGYGGYNNYRGRGGQTQGQPQAQGEVGQPAAQS